MLVGFYLMFWGWGPGSPNPSTLLYSIGLAVFRHMLQQHDPDFYNLHIFFFVDELGYDFC